MAEETNGTDGRSSSGRQYGLARAMTNGELVYEDEYQPKNILLTGGAGFIGSHVALLLIQKYPDYKVRALCFALCYGCTAGVRTGAPFRAFPVSLHALARMCSQGWANLRHGDHLQP
jgi:hypothetical protein